jgi:hypothetical protein
LPLCLDLQNLRDNPERIGFARQVSIRVVMIDRGSGVRARLLNQSSKAVIYIARHMARGISNAGGAVVRVIDEAGNACIRIRDLKEPIEAVKCLGSLMVQAVFHRQRIAIVVIGNGGGLARARNIGEFAAQCIEPFPPFTATQPAKVLPDLCEFCSAPIFATAGRAE